MRCRVHQQAQKKGGNAMQPSMLSVATCRNPNGARSAAHGDANVLRGHGIAAFVPALPARHACLRWLWRDKRRDER